MTACVIRRGRDDRLTTQGPAMIADLGVCPATAGRAAVALWPSVGAYWEPVPRRGRCMLSHGEVRFFILLGRRFAETMLELLGKQGALP